MAYCGAVGSVHVLSLLSTDLFDEAQENPFLLSAAGGHGHGDADGGVAEALELPLDDEGPAQPDAPLQYSPGRTVRRASASPLRSILKRQSSYESTAAASEATDASLVEAETTAAAETVARPEAVEAEAELQRLLSSLTRFGLASDGASPLPPPPPVPAPATLETEAEPDAFVLPSASPCGARRPTRGASVTFAMVKSLLRGGGGGQGSPSRTARRSVPDFRRKSMGTISSRLKRRRKFLRPTILTDAYHRVSDMRLGTKPMGPAVKHLAFPEQREPPEDRAEADAGMPSPRGALSRRSRVALETLDRIGTRAASPVHLLAAGGTPPDFSHVRARVDSYNHVRSASRALRRPSAWLHASMAASPSPSPLASASASASARWSFHPEASLDDAESTS